MRVLICGVDGYLGHALACHLMASGHEVAGTDSLKRRLWVHEVGSDSAIPIQSPGDRVAALLEHFGGLFDCAVHVDLQDYDGLRDLLERFRPEAIVHLAEQPSAPFSMIDQAHAAMTQENNVIGSLNLLWAMKEVAPEAHLIKLGTMGEYGTPDCPIPEGVFPEGSTWCLPGGSGPDRLLHCGHYRDSERWNISGIMFPRKASSFYHQTKVFDTHNTMFACRTWGLRSTDIMQGVVYGTWIPAFGDDPRLRTRFDYDECFGTAINRFVAQAIVGHPMTLYDRGHQKRGFLPLRDSMQCLTLAIENPPDGGEYRTFNQFEEVYTIEGLAQQTGAAAVRAGIEAQIACYVNPRDEANEHIYLPVHEHLLNLGYQPTHDMDAELDRMFADLLPHADRIREHVDHIAPFTHWSGQHHKAEALAIDYQI